jgi:predicted RNA-binding Zn-ribbon protein involved in translation (DUF1610 family)
MNGIESKGLDQGEDSLPPSPIDRPILDKVPTPLKDTPLGRAILKIIEEFERNDESVRHRNSMKWKKHLHYWNSLQYLFESEIAHDWVSAEGLRNDPENDIDISQYAKIVNVYKANGEIIIGALTPNVPKVRYYPKDADDPDDVTTSKAYSKISELIQRQNKAQIILMKAVFILYNQGMVAAYNENKRDPRFGEESEDIYDDITVWDREHNCPNCGAPINSTTHADGETGQIIDTMQCPNCGYTGPADFEDQQRTQQVYAGTKKRPKNRECIEIYGPLNVKVPMWAKDQQSCHLLILETEESIYELRSIYPEYEKDIQGQDLTEDRESRIPSNYAGDFPRDLSTVKRVWLRPKSYYYWGSDTEEFQALSKFAEGLYAVIINNDLIVEAIGDKLDDHWTISEHPLAETLHAEPMGTVMVPMQDITNELANLSLETIEFGISEVFADSKVLDFDQYEKQEVKPGQITPATAPAGMALSNGFYEIRPATMPEGIEFFSNRVESMTQFVMGTYPSVFGGALAEGGGTAREYEMSKSSALQRLTTTWNILQYWWADLMGKSVKSYAENMRGDENFVKSQGSNFLNVWVRKVEMSGSIGEIMPEVSETLPVSWTQKRDVILNLMNMKDPRIGDILAHPENASLVASTIGVAELYIPGDDDRNKQLKEISDLLMAEPIMGPMGPVSSVPITPELDNHAVEAEVCKGWLKSEVGLEMKGTPGYMNVLAHLKEHLMQLMMQMPPPGSEEEENGEGNLPKPKKLPPPDHIGEVSPQGVANA